MSYSKCSNWCPISKLSSNFGFLFTFCYLDGANSIKTDLHICNLWTGQFASYKSVISFSNETNLDICNLWTSQFVSYKSVIQFLINFPKQNSKKQINIQSLKPISIFDSNQNTSNMTYTTHKTKIRFKKPTFNVQQMCLRFIVTDVE